MTTVWGIGGVLGWLRSRGYGAIAAFRNLSAALLLGIGAAAAEPVTVVALGDSLTAGFGLTPGDGFVPQMQRWLDTRDAQVELRNAGVSGDTTQGGLARVGWALTPDVEAVMVILGGNDMLRGIDPALARRNLAGILAAARDAGLPALLVGLRAPGNYGADYKAEFDAIYPELAREYDALFAADFLAPVVAAIEGGAAFGALMQADGLHPNAAGVAMIVEALGPKVQALADRVE